MLKNENGKLKRISYPVPSCTHRKQNGIAFNLGLRWYELKNELCMVELKLNVDGTENSACRQKLTPTEPKIEYCQIGFCILRLKLKIQILHINIFTL